MVSGERSGNYLGRTKAGDEKIRRRQQRDSLSAGALCWAMELWCPASCTAPETSRFGNGVPELSWD